jgi:hypothetical protein
MTRYQEGIKIGHAIKIIEFQMNYVTNLVATKQVILGIINEFFNSSYK